MRVVVAAVSLILASPVAAGQPAQKTDRLAGKKLIEWGWDEPGTRFMRENIEKMEQLPFDGLVFHADTSRGGQLAWQIWGTRRFELAEFHEAIDDLHATRFRRFTERFLRVNVTPGNVDWFDDGAWEVVQANFGVAARVAKQGKARGFMFDVEQYNDPLFHYAKQKHHGTRTFAQYQAKVRQRGRQWMAEVAQHYPEITILLTFGYRIAQPAPGADRSTGSYALLADFLDGLLEACPEGVTIVDAWEFSYPYKRAEQFREAYETIKVRSAAWCAVPEKYRRVEAGFGLWMDCAWRQKGWNTEDFSKNHFTPAEFERAVRAALETSDRYVWIYTEQPRWWTNQRLPPAYVEALCRARQPSDPPSP
ncbi:MAG: hypothetical protein ACUVUC_08585 [Thermoguttaceae bacterium]